MRGWGRAVMERKLGGGRLVGGWGLLFIPRGRRTNSQLGLYYDFFFFRSRGVFSTLPLFFFPYKIVGYYCILVSFLHIVGLAWLGTDCGFGSAVVFGFGFGFVYLLLVILNQLLCILRCARKVSVEGCVMVHDSLPVHSAS